MDEIAEIVAAVVPGSRVVYAKGGEAVRRSYRVDCEKARTALPGFVPAWTVRRCAEELYVASRRVELTLEGVSSSRFLRVQRIRELLAAGALGTTLRRRASIFA